MSLWLKSFNVDPSKANPCVLVILKQMSRALCFRCDGLLQVSKLIYCIKVMSVHMHRAVWLHALDIKATPKEHLIHLPFKERHLGSCTWQGHSKYYWESDWVPASMQEMSRWNLNLYYCSSTSKATTIDLPLKALCLICMKVHPNVCKWGPICSSY